ncbi:MAG: septum formation initiator family protein [Clostridiales bacterium]|nr:septum formation initiator family protein [Clostridiales bacterium]
MKKKGKIFWGVVVIFFGVIFIKQQLTINGLNKEYKNYTDQLSKLQVQSSQLNEQLNQSEKESYLEKLAREKLGLAKTGEIIFKIKK